MPCTEQKHHGQCWARNACALALADYIDLFQGDVEHEIEVEGKLNGVSMGIDHSLGKWECTFSSKSVWVVCWFSFLSSWNYPTPPKKEKKKNSYKKYAGMKN